MVLRAKCPGHRGDDVKLFEITDQIEEIFSAGTDRETGEISDEALEALDELEIALSKKALDVAAFIRGEECEAAAIRDQAKRLEERASVHERRAARLTKYLAEHVDGQAFADSRVQIKWTRSSAVEVDDVERLPARMVRTKTSLTPVRAEIKAAIKSGQTVPGARIVERKKMRIV